MLTNPKDSNSVRVHSDERPMSVMRIVIGQPMTDDGLTKNQRDIQHMMSCRKNDCRRCDG